MRDRYGRHSWGQSCLLARRLVEAGVRLVHVNWPREPGDNAVDNPMWDTHALNADRLQDTLCPLFDVTFAALLDDLGERGLLAETLVVAIGEFGRTPQINAQGGRDHWGSVFCGVLAGAGIAGGQVFGASDKIGAYPTVDPIRPHDLTATVFHLLGIPHDGFFHDRTNRPQSLTKGEPLYRLLGEESATLERCLATGDERFVPSFDARLLFDTDFAAKTLIPVSPVSREKGWRAAPLLVMGNTGMVASAVAEPRPHVQLAVIASPDKPYLLTADSRLIVAQEIRNARGGHYDFTARISGGGSSKEGFERLFGGGLTCRLVLFRFANQNKNPLEASELASESFKPTYCQVEQAIELTLSRFLGSETPGANFAIGNGLGVAVIVENTTPQELAPGETAFLRLHEVRLAFNPAPTR